MKKRLVTIADASLGDGLPLLLVAGPCVIETREGCLAIAEELKSVCERLGMPLVFKASYDKANRTSVRSFRGPGLDEGLKILGEVKRQFGLPVLSDVHAPDQCAIVADTLDCLQIPAFLCRQTDLVIAAAETGRPLNIKKAQFMAPEDMGNVCAKAESAGNSQIVLTERGTAFGYHRLVNDMRSIPAMQSLGRPVLFDATHSVQSPGGAGDRSGGDRKSVAPLALAGVAAGADGLFLEVHPEPEKALSDAAAMLSLSRLPGLLTKAQRIREIVVG